MSEIDGEQTLYLQLDNVVDWRLGRSLPHLIATVTDLRERGIRFRSLTEEIDITTPGDKLAVHVFGALASLSATSSGSAPTPGGRPPAKSSMLRSWHCSKRSTMGAGRYRHHLPDAGHLSRYIVSISQNYALRRGIGVEPRIFAS